MKDNPTQPPTEAGYAGYGKLTERLLRRHTDPGGLIDVRHAERHYSRTAGWVAERFGLLEHWKTRYDVDDSGAVSGPGLAFSTSLKQPELQPISEVPGKVSVTPGMPEVTRSAYPAAPDVSSSRRGEVRVRRRAGDSASPSRATTNVVSSTERLDPEVPATDAGGLIGKSEIPVSDRAVSVDSKPLTIMRKAAQVPAAATRPEPEGARNRRAPLVQRTGGDGVVAPPAALSREQRQVDGQASSIQMGSPIPSARPDVRHHPGESMAILRQSASVRPAGEVKDVDATPDRAFPVVLTAPEIRATSPVMQKPEIIWRKTVDGSPAERLSSGISESAGGVLPWAINRASEKEGVVFRRAEPASNASGSEVANYAESTELAKSAKPTPAPAAQIDLAQLADRVGRLLSRQLAVERERRGIKGWN
jgi:hypothetical protein